MALPKELILLFPLKDKVKKEIPYFRGTDNYNFAFAQPWDSSCLISNEKHGNYGLHGEWYRNGTEYCLTVQAIISNSQL
jgi:hypothetical protein